MKVVSIIFFLICYTVGAPIISEACSSENCSKEREMLIKSHSRARNTIENLQFILNITSIYNSGGISVSNDGPLVDSLMKAKIFERDLWLMYKDLVKSQVRDKNIGLVSKKIFGVTNSFIRYEYDVKVYLEKQEIQYEEKFKELCYQSISSAIKINDQVKKLTETDLVEFYKKTGYSRDIVPVLPNTDASISTSSLNKRDTFSPKEKEEVLTNFKNFVAIAEGTGALLFCLDGGYTVCVFSLVGMLSLATFYWVRDALPMFVGEDMSKPTE